MKNNGTNILLIDSAVENQIVRLKDVADWTLLHEHTVKISGLLAAEPFTGTDTGFSLSNVISASYKDAFNQGYGALRERILHEFGACPIEAHAYSVAENEHNIGLHTALSKYPDGVPEPYILASAGHDIGRQRFPGSSSETIGVALLQSNGDIPGIPPLGHGNVEFLVEEFDYPTQDVSRQKTITKGTSAAVVYLAGLASSLHQQLHQQQLPNDRLALHSAMLCLARRYQDFYLFDHTPLLASPLQSRIVNIPRAKQAEIQLTAQSSIAGTQIAVVASYQGKIAREAQLSMQLNDQSILGSRGTLLVAREHLVSGVTNMTLHVDGRIDRLTLAGQAIFAADITQLEPLVAPGDDIIVGISASHDASACLMINGKISYGIQLERLTRVKRDGRSVLDSTLAVDYCLEAAGLTRDDVNCFAYNIQSATPEYIGLNQPVCSADFRLFAPYSDDIVVASHHLCHAFAAWSGSRFREGNVVVIDGSGGTVVGHDDLLLSGTEFARYLNTGLEGKRPELHVVSHYVFTEDNYTLRHREYSPSFNVRSGSCSLGEAYAAVSQLVFNSWHASGKLMGLAPYGSPKFADEIAIESPQGISFGYNWKQKFTEKKSNPMDYADLAASVQMVLEKGVFSRLEHYGLDNSEPLVMTGGVALNSVVNHKVRQQFKLKDFYLFPAQHDAGISIGAATAAYYKRHGKILSNAFNHDYLGKIYSYHQVGLTLNRFADRIQVSPIDVQSLAARLHAGQIIGYFSCKKGSEFGPRALGARSLLASPCSMDTWKFINKWVKFREDFRPFAPMVAAEHLNRYFEGEGEHKYMLEVLPVREEYRKQLAAITHVDGSARVQTVSASDNAEIHALLNAFAALSDFPILLNTSFNVRGQPIVEQPQQAIEMLLSTHIDAVVFDDYIVELRLSSFRDDHLPGLLRLSPGCKLQSVLEKNEHRYQLIHEYQGHAQCISTPLYQAIAQLVSFHQLVEAQQYYSGLSQGLKQQLVHYVRLKFLNIAHDFSSGNGHAKVS